jgi:hypothetical protein
MVKRLFSLVVALAIAGAPVALEACQIACTSTSVHPVVAHDTQPAHHHHPTGAHGSCHEPRAAPHHLSPQAPACDHDDSEATVRSVTAARTSDGVLLYAAAVPPIADLGSAAASAFVPIRQSTLPDPLEIRVASPLRI